MYNIICKNCGKSFQAKYKERKFCSRKCYNNSMKNSIVNDYSHLIGKKFGRLTVVKKDEKDKRHPHLICNCECGKTISINIEHLLSGRSKSCGCLRIENTFVENTSLNTINSKIRIDNKSGVRGVGWYKATNRWVAHIAFQKRKYTLGYYTDIKDAIKARKKAEEEFFKPIQEKYKTNK